MSVSKTIIISCAGMGNRLGIGTTKALIDIDGKPLIIRQLELLDQCDDIRIVVGYQAEKVIEVVNKYRKDITFVFNHDYMNNGTGASLSYAMKNSNDYIVSLDGDLLVHPDDMKMILGSYDEYVGGCKIYTDDPVLIKVSEENKAIAFSREDGDYEWTGLVQIRSDRLKSHNGHVYQLLEPCLPLSILEIRTREIDTMNDYEKALKWVKNNYNDDTDTIGIMGGMGSYATLDFFRRLLNAFPAEKEWDRPRIIIDNYCTMPSRVRAVLYNENREELIKCMASAVKNMIDTGATQIIFACNTSHCFLDDIYRLVPESKRKVIHIIEACAQQIDNMGINEVSLIASEGTILSKIYVKIFDRYKIKINTPDKSDFIKIRDIIESIKQNQINNETKLKFIQLLEDQKCKDVIIGCTELPIVYSDLKEKVKKMGINVIDPLESSIHKLKEVIKKDENISIN